MFHLRFNFIDSIDGKRCTLLDFRSLGFRDQAFFGQRFYNSQLNIEPALIFILIFPDFAHSRACVTRNHNYLASGPPVICLLDRLSAGPPMPLFTIAEPEQSVRLVMLPSGMYCSNPDRAEIGRA